ncbi:MAG TPA: sigma-70 family RNA polymerase sigma factor [Polyangiaceae bacterium]
MVPNSETERVVRACFRAESPRIIASLTRLVRDVGVAEELAQDTLLAALVEWPERGVPENPAAWLMVSAKHRAINHLRRARMLERKHAELGHDRHESAPEIEAMLDDDIGDDLLRLMFTACHPLLPTEARVALTLRLLGGLGTEEIARAYLVSEPTIAQRIVRAKRTLSEAGVPFEVPRGPERSSRLASVLEVIYLVFNEGYSATAGDDLLRPALCEDAIRLGRVLSELVPGEPEAHALLSLMELHAARTPARTDANGEPVLLLEQDRARWDGSLLESGLAALARAEALPGPPGSYRLQAAVAACHARARAAGETDWRRIAALYAELAAMTRSPVVELNRAVAVGMAEGPAAALPLIDALAGDPALRNYHLVPAARADLLAKLGRTEEARGEFERAAALTKNLRQRERLLARARDCGK